MIKKLMLLFAIFFCIGGISFADVLPRYSYNIRYTGIGAFNVPEEFTVYSEPDETSQVLDVISRDSKGLTDKTRKENDIFVAFLPKKNIAYCAVDDEIDGWVKIYYSQKTGSTGWVKTTPTNRFISWLGFYMLLGRKHGIYLFKDMPQVNKRVMSAPDANSQKIAEFIYPKFIKLTLVRGNWMLVKILDIGDTVHVGWLQWRDENGKFMAFPDLNKN